MSKNSTRGTRPIPSSITSENKTSEDTRGLLVAKVETADGKSAFPSTTHEQVNAAGSPHAEHEPEKYIHLKIKDGLGATVNLKLDVRAVTQFVRQLGRMRSNLVAGMQIPPWKLSDLEI